MLKNLCIFLFQSNNYDSLIGRTRFHAAIAVARLSYYVDVYSISPYTSIVLHVFWYVHKCFFTVLLCRRDSTTSKMG